MVKASKARTRAARTRSAVSDADRRKRHTYQITQRGVKTSTDLSGFHAAALADIDSGRADLKEMNAMRSITGQIIAHENLKLKAGGYKNGRKNNFLTA